MRIFLLKLIKFLTLFVLLIAVAITAFIQFAPVFGGKPDDTSLKKIAASNNHDGRVFINLVPTELSTPSDEEVSFMDFFNPPPQKNPSTPLPSRLFDETSFQNNDFVWFGHSTVLMKLAGQTIITDPVFHSAAPISFLVKPFAMQVDNKVADLPEIDVVLISHDHYDHLDYRTIQEIDAKVKNYLVPLGIKAHLQRWGVADTKIVELDWYEGLEIGGVKLTLTPSRHFSGRGLNNRFSTLWGSWVIQSNTSNVFFSGDSGYFKEFKKIGEEFGPFDITFMENGAYNKAWDQIHMYPEQSVQASLDLNAGIYFPVHWGKYDLSIHQWTDPIIRAKKAAQEFNTTVATPMIGEIFTPHIYPQTEWWKSVK